MGKDGNKKGKHKITFAKVDEYVQVNNVSIVIFL